MVGLGSVVVITNCNSSPSEAGGGSLRGICLVTTVGGALEGSAAVVDVVALALDPSNSSEDVMRSYL